MVIQGFGNVGGNAARILHERGYRIVAVSDSRGGIYRAYGLHIPGVIEHKERTGQVKDFPGAAPITNDELLTCECDVLVPSALSEQINEANAARVKAQIVLELANAPTTTEADDILFEKGVMVIPDILANAGGVVVSYFEWSQNLNNDYWEEERVLGRLKSIMITAFKDVVTLCSESRCRLRRAAYLLAVRRVLHAERLRGNL